MRKEFIKSLCIVANSKSTHIIVAAGKCSADLLIKNIGLCMLLKVKQLTFIKVKPSAASIPNPGYFRADHYQAQNVADLTFRAAKEVQN